ncbi:MAG: hypothetical protein PHX08_21005 [Lachnospiraceae bacterium]|nr:hypothetical protein [Lachnospiraceae bacterium]
MDETTMMVMVCALFILICIVIVVVGIKQDKKKPFKIQKRVLSNGSVQLEIPNFYKKNQDIMDEFYKKYEINNIITLDGKEYVVCDMKKVFHNDSMIKPTQFVMCIYLAAIE